MDGYALRADDLDKNLATQIVGTALAGQPFLAKNWLPVKCVRIMTGAIVPLGADGCGECKKHPVEDGIVVV